MHEKKSIKDKTKLKKKTYQHEIVKSISDVLVILFAM